MKQILIMVVDDDPSIRKFIKANLEARDYRVLIAGDGKEAIQIMEEELPELILLDIMMPEMDGFQVCKAIREWSQVPIVMLSARDSESDKVKCLDTGADDYLTKQFSLKELLSRINAVLRRSQITTAASTPEPDFYRRAHRGRRGRMKKGFRIQDPKTFHSCPSLCSPRSLT